MDAIVGFFTGVSSLGVSVVMPIVLTIIGCLFGCGFGKSLKAGLTVGQMAVVLDCPTAEITRRLPK